MRKSRYNKPILYGLLSALAFFLISGVVTKLIPNDFFLRMTPITLLDYFFLTATSTLIGVFVALHVFHKHESKVCTASAVGGGVGGFLAFGCSVCNQILVLLLGVAGVLAFVEPYRPVFGLVGIGFLGVAISLKVREINKSKSFNP